jgi:SAM-dependent methyltransferase
MNFSNQPTELGDSRGRYFDLSYVSQVSCESRGTKVEKQIEFIEQKILSFFKYPKILDLCCGYGRHLEWLSKKGLNLTGVDINQAFIDIALQKTSGNVQLICCDARQFVNPNTFDVVLNLETSLNCFDYEDALLTLSNIHQSLREGGLFLLHVFNPEFAIRELPHRTWIKTEDGMILLEKRKFDSKTNTVLITQIRLLPLNSEGNYRESTHQIKLLMLTYDKLCEMLTRVGFSIQYVYGNFQGAACGSEFPDLIFVCSR